MTKYRLPYLTCLLAFTISSYCYGQHQYIPVLKDSALWLTEKEDWHEGENPPPPHTFTYSAGWTDGKDTVLNGKYYDCYFGEEGGMPPSIGQYAAYFGEWIREDTISKKIWYIRTKSHTEKEELLYDFSLQAGDTITDTNSSYFSPDRLYPYKAWIDQVDSVHWADGSWRYRWWIKSEYGPIGNTAHTMQIEGMGYINNFLDDPFLEFHPLVGYTNRVVCYAEKGQWLYEQANHWNADCDTMLAHNITVGIKTINSNELGKALVYPNPVMNGEELHINSYAGAANEHCELSIFNVEGQKVFCKTVIPGELVLTSGIAPGLYFLILNNSKAQRIICEELMVY